MTNENVTFYQRLLRTFSENIDLIIFLVISLAQKLRQNLEIKLRKSYERFWPRAVTNPSTTQDLVIIASARGLPVLYCFRGVMHIDLCF